MQFKKGTLNKLPCLAKFKKVFFSVGVLIIFKRITVYSKNTNK